MTSHRTRAVKFVTLSAEPDDDVRGNACAIYTRALLAVMSKARVTLFARRRFQFVFEMVIIFV